MMRATRFLLAGLLTLACGVAHAEDDNRWPMPEEMGMEQPASETEEAKPATAESKAASPEAAPASEAAPGAEAMPEAEPTLHSAPLPTAEVPVATEQYPQTPTPARNDPNRPRNLDLRHCLGLGDSVAISKCAGE